VNNFYVIGMKKKEEEKDHFVVLFFVCRVRNVRHPRRGQTLFQWREKRDGAVGEEGRLEKTHRYVDFKDTKMNVKLRIF